MKKKRREGGKGIGGQKGVGDEWRVVGNKGDREKKEVRGRREMRNEERRQRVGYKRGMGDGWYNARNDILMV